jgi:hypothetical protein
MRNPKINSELFSGIFDPNLPALQTLSDLLVYSAASALAGQESRSVSDFDVKKVQGMVGDPRSFLMSQQKFLAKLETLGDIVAGIEGSTQEFVDQNRGGRSQASPLDQARDAIARGAPRDRVLQRLQQNGIQVPADF